LSRSEQAIFEHLRTSARVDFYWDHDDYFTADPRQEAGMFMRDNLRRFPPADGVQGGVSGGSGGGHNNFVKPKTIRSVAAASDVLQCKYAGLALSCGTPGGIGNTARRIGKETAIVLCDESLLSPLLWSMPPGVDAINITMGYPLRLHPSYTLVERLIELQNRRRGTGPSVAFYHSDVHGLLRHPCLCGGGNGRGNNAPQVGHNFVYISARHLRTSPIFERIFTAPDSGSAKGDADSTKAEWRALSDYLIGTIETIAQAEQIAQLPPDGGTDDSTNRNTDGNMGRQAEFFALIVEHIRRLAFSLEGCGIEPSTRTYTRLLRRSLQSVTVPFEGEPLEGVQVMGILETRALDFENIIFLSAGDEAMPGNLVGAPSFIPYSLKAAYGLPTPEHHEGVYAYHFFRLISRARHIEMVWSRTADDRNSGTPSRYILQLEYESPHTVEKRTVDVDVNLSPPEPIVIPKDPSVMARLREFLIERTPGSLDEPAPAPAASPAASPAPATAPRRLSPSLFFTHTECPLKFYFRGVARLRPDDEVSEEIDGALFGSILHGAMQRLYSPLVGVWDPRQQIRALIGSRAVERAVTAAIEELYPGSEGARPEDWGGNILLARKTIIDYIDRGILPFDGSGPVGFAIERLEEPLSETVSFSGGTVLFHGVADRIDRLDNGTLCVVDYKTGNPKNNASAVQQMGLYALMVGTPTADFCHQEQHQEQHREQNIETALYYLRDMSRPGSGNSGSGRNSNDSTPGHSDGKYSGVIREKVSGNLEFLQNIRDGLSELFDPAVPFTQTLDSKVCEWCDYRAICNR
ncbi:MAG: PD-(D/E)XK nuclease family protein, partial [Alistipes sp.]|nr:PD-(D/E)XK nuclease family protein [Alistipes sp.]